MTNNRRIKRPPARVPDVPPAVDVSIYPDAAGVLFVVPGYVARVNAWIHPDRQPDNTTPAASSAAVQNGPKRPNAAPWPNGLNGLSMPERPERVERPERFECTRMIQIGRTTRTAGVLHSEPARMLLRHLTNCRLKNRFITYFIHNQIERVMKTSYGLEFNLLPPERLDDFHDYDRTVASCHIQNCGHIIVSAQYGDPIDNEDDLAEIYKQLENEQV